MVIEHAIGELSRALRVVEEDLLAVIVTVEHDRPDSDTLLGVDMEDRLRDATAPVTEAAELAAILMSAAADPPTPSEIRRGLARCHELHLASSRAIRDELLGADQSRRIRQLANSRRGPWLPWAKAVLDGLAMCREPLWAVDEALLRAWETLADRSLGTEVSVRSIGQHIRVR